MASATIPTIDYMTLHPVTDTDTVVSCALRINAPKTVDRVSTHFILLLDISESMMDANKLENCKKCASLLLNFMTQEDRISLITFGDSATLHLKQVSADDTNKTIMKEKIESLRCDGCTNLSAGLGYVREACEGSTLKTGLLLLTDGHANRGVSDTGSLCGIVQSLHTSFENLSIHCVAYGTDHNEDLLRTIAEDIQGSYNVVNSIEDTALAFGDTLGGLMSCAYQNVKIHVPSTTKVHGPHKVHQEGDNHYIPLGDVFAGTNPLILFDIPTSVANCIDCVRVTGMSLPSLESWSLIPIQQYMAERNVDIELTQLRYKCTAILKDIHDWRQLSQEKKDGMKGRIDEFERAVQDEFFNNHPVTGILRSEVSTLRSMLEEASRGQLNHETSVYAAQHLTSIALGRGWSSPRAVPPSRRMRRQNAVYVSPSNASDPDADAGGEPHQGLYVDTRPHENETTENPLETTTAFWNDTQQRVANLMRTASQQQRP